MTTKKQTIAVIGAGSWGTALAIVLAKNGYTVSLWDQDKSILADIAETRCNSRYLPEIVLPNNIVIPNSEHQTIENVKDIVLVIPSHAFGPALKALKPVLNSSHRFICATKGLEPGTGELLHKVAERELNGNHPYAVLSGPSFAKEVAMGLPTAVMMASRQAAFAKEAAQLFNQDNFRVYTTDDIIGVQIGNVVKNVLAVAVGISDGVGFGANARAALMTLGLEEMMHLGDRLGARRETFMGLAGCGDVILTCTDNQSRNRRFGLALAEGLSEKEALQRIGQVVEAVYNVDQLRQLAKTYQVKLPIAEQVFRIMRERVPPQEALGALFKGVTFSESLANT